MSSRVLRANSLRVISGGRRISRLDWFEPGGHGIGCKADSPLATGPVTAPAEAQEGMHAACRQPRSQGEANCCWPRRPVVQARQSMNVTAMHRDGCRAGQSANHWRANRALCLARHTDGPQGMLHLTTAHLDLQELLPIVDVSWEMLPGGRIDPQK